MKLGAGAVPVPERLTEGIGTLVLLLIVKEPLRAPVRVGVKVTVMVQDADTARVEPQLFVCAKSPVAWMEEIVTGELAVLKRNKDWGPPVVFRS